MEIIANGQQIPFTVAEEKNLKDVIETLLLLSSQANRLIIECKVNEKPVSLMDRTGFEDMPIETINKIELRVENKTIRVLESLDEIERLFPIIINSFGEVADTLIAGQKNKALTAFSESLGNWRKIINFLRVIEAAYKLNFELIEVNGRTIDKINSELYDLLSEIKKAIENEDLVSIGDLIEYELKDTLKEQQSIIGSLKTVVQEKADTLEQQIP
jgi:hypothetical protein